MNLAATLGNGRSAIWSGPTEVTGKRIYRFLWQAILLLLVIESLLLVLEHSEFTFGSPLLSRSPGFHQELRLSLLIAC
jgi:hypothetical protein